MTLLTSKQNNIENNKFYLELILTLAFIAIIYFSTFKWLFERYTAADTYYSHGFLIPFVSGILIWLKRRELKTIGREYSLWGLLFIILALSIHVLSVGMEVFFISGFSIILLLFGISLFLYGGRITKKIIFPLTFLVFMVPLPLVAINAISFPMKMLVTKTAILILRSTLNIPMKNEGFQIFFPHASLIVENPCSGLRSLISMLALGSIFAYLLKASMKKKVSLFLLSVPIALISNLFRVIILCLGVYIYGSGIAKGFFHDFSGFLVFAIGFVALWAAWEKLQCKN